MHSDELIDAFVEKVNGSPRKRIREEDIPLALRAGGAELGLYYDWTIQKSDQIFWIDPLELKLPAVLPPSYRSLVSRYLFPAFDVHPILLLANTGQTLYHEMTLAMSEDKVLSELLLKNGFAQFARPSSGDSDPACFDYNRRENDGECPIVRISHRGIVFDSKVQVMKELAPSFRALVSDYLEHPLTSRRTLPHSIEKTLH